MTNTTTTELAARATIAVRSNTHATIAVVLPDGTRGVASCLDIVATSGGQDVEVRQGKRRELWWLSQLTLAV